ncbi:MAG: peptide-methionine (S)-S-oxide reductase, partial [Spirulinaceae cyanobacterium]
QETTALASKAELEKSGKYQNKIVTEIKPACQFYLAEDYHQQYLEKKAKQQ